MKVRYGYNGAHLFNRSSGLNVLVDEIRIDPTQWSLAPRYVSFALTNACELACSYCYASKVPAKLSPSQVLRWARELDSAGCLGIGFGGGEPTLFPGFALLCRELHSETELAISMTTHGHRFSPKLVDQLSGNIEFIRVSMDGVGPTYEALRGRSFAAFREKLNLVRATAKFGLNFIVNSDTIRDLPAAAEFAFDSGAQEFLLLPETTIGGALNVAPEVMNELSTWVTKNFDRCRLATSAHSIKHLDAPALLYNDPAYESFDFMHVDALATLKVTAFSKVGIALNEHSTMIECIKSVRELLRQQSEEAVQ